MTDWFDKMLRFNEGFFNTPENQLPAAHANLDRRLGDQMGGPHRGASSGASEDAGSGDRGCLAGFRNLAAAAGAFLAALPFILLKSAWSKASDKRLWSRRGADNTAETLVQYWTDSFGLAPDPVFIQSIDENGAAWIVDGKGNFIVRTGNGREFFIGNDPDKKEPTLIVRKHRGKGFDIEDAFAIMLANRSLGRSSTSLTGGRKNARRLMWVAAKLAHIEIRDYTPDRDALALLNELRPSDGS